MKILAFIFLMSLFSCSSYKEFQSLREEDVVPAKTLPFDFDQTWQATLQVLQKYDLASQSQELGSIKTRWIDNTLELNFADSFGKSESIKSARFKLVVNVTRADRLTRSLTKVSIYKRQMIEKEFLQGTKPERSDGILEATLLYRVQRVLEIEKELKRLKEIKNKQLEESL
jgi:hypothetical protein